VELGIDQTEYQEIKENTDWVNLWKMNLTLFNMC